MGFVHTQGIVTLPVLEPLVRDLQSIESYFQDGPVAEGRL